jgi:rhodanese-related sulfurtransferase
MKHISVPAFKEVLESEHQNETVDFINVCEPAEYKEKHIPGVRNVPLSKLKDHLDSFLGKKTIYVHCRSGKRGQKAIEELEKLGVNAELVNVEGGLLAWDEAGYQTNSLTNRLPVMRQVFIAAGALILIGYIGMYAVHTSLQFIIPFVGAGLLVSGITGWCGMAILLSKMPWNKK